ncbi:unnamed protein product [Amoebophrya sp. A120]|nr:unnamed protein product [Amoebophrya sp. A120]|eukprot:GSA120T00017603001.1
MMHLLFAFQLCLLLVQHSTAAYLPTLRRKFSMSPEAEQHPDGKPAARLFLRQTSSAAGSSCSLAANSTTDGEATVSTPTDSMPATPTLTPAAAPEDPEIPPPPPVVQSSFCILCHDDKVTKPFSTSTCPGGIPHTLGHRACVRRWMTHQKESCGHVWKDGVKSNCLVCFKPVKFADEDRLRLYKNRCIVCFKPLPAKARPRREGNHTDEPGAGTPTTAKNSWISWAWLQRNERLRRAGVVADPTSRSTSDAATSSCVVEPPSSSDSDEDEMDTATSSCSATFTTGREIALALFSQVS